MYCSPVLWPAILSYILRHRSCWTNFDEFFFLLAHQIFPIAFRFAHFEGSHCDVSQYSALFYGQGVLYPWRPYNIPKCLYTINLLQPTGHVMHQQFNIQQLHALPTLYLCVLYLSENNCATYSINWLVFINEMKSVAWAVRTGTLKKAVCASYLKG